MIRRPPRSTRTDTPFPYTTLFRSFKSGVERILARAADAGRPVPVVPMALRGMWASMWSRRGTSIAGSRLDRLRVPRRFRAHVEVLAGEPADGHAAYAPSLEAQVRELGSETWSERERQHLWVWVVRDTSKKK